MTHFWIRAEERGNEARVGVTPEGVARLAGAGFRVTVEDDPNRAIAIGEYRAAGATVAPPGTWREAPADAVILGLKELADDGRPLRHRHIMFGHAYKGQAEGRRLLDRFAAGGGTLLDLEYLTDTSGRRVAAFGVWAGFAGAAMSLMALGAQARSQLCPAGRAYGASDELVQAVRAALGDLRPRVIVIGARGRVGTGARDLCRRVGIEVTGWDVEETAHGGPFPEILDHEVFLNCILATPGVPVFVGPDALDTPRRLRVIGDIACDPGSAFSPVPLYDRATTWEAPVIRVHDAPPLDIMAIDNLPSMLPREAAQDFAAQLLPHLLAFDDDPDGVWSRAEAVFRRHV